MNSAESNKNVDKVFYSWPASEDHVDHVEVCTNKMTDTDKTPVKGSDEYQQACCLAQVHTGGGKELKGTLSTLKMILALHLHNVLLPTDSHYCEAVPFFFARCVVLHLLVACFA